MDYVKPVEVVDMMIHHGTAKANLSLMQMLIRGFLGGAILACATTLAFNATIQFGMGIVGAIIFPAGFVMIVLLGLELVTGSFALIPLAVLEKRTTIMSMLANYGVVVFAHLLGCAVYALLYTMTITKMGTEAVNPLVEMMIQVSEAKTLGYKSLGGEGLVMVIVQAVLCNWMVTLGVVMALTSTSTLAKIIAMWLPIVTFFAQGFEHAVVNMFVIPAGMLLGADISMADWWLWNQLPVLLGNFIGGALLTGVPLYLTQKQALKTLP